MSDGMSDGLPTSGKGLIVSRQGRPVGVVGSGEEDKILVVKLGINGMGPWMIFPMNEPMEGLLEEIKDLAVEDTGDELTLRVEKMTQEEINNMGEFPGW